MSIRVAIVEDQELVRTGLRMILDSADGIEVQNVIVAERMNTFDR